ncbi:MAG: hypothetical protein IT390_09115 [Nitrospira sp.]|nr:hypothetical protein [Nitrospira sp.]
MACFTVGRRANTSGASVPTRAASRRSFKCKETQALFEGKAPRRFKAFARIAERKLAQLHAAQSLEFLRSPPGNSLEALKGD